MIFLLPALIRLFSFVHDFHTAMADIVYSEQSRSLQVSLKVFTDDLELGAGTFLGQKFLVANDSSIEPGIVRYLENKFRISVAGKPLKVNYIGKEFESDVTWLYLEVPVPKKPVDIQISFCLLMEVFGDQMNLANVKIGGEKKTLLFTGGNCEKDLKTVGK